jgi:hypothetical protein
MKRIVTVMVTVMAMAILPGSALALSSSTCQTYHPQTCKVVSTTTTGTTATGSVLAGTLPFTGLDVALLLAGGALLLGTGLVVRRFSRHLD